MKIWFVFIVSIMVASCSADPDPQEFSAATEQNYNFRKTKWRMTHHEVRLAESATFIVEHPPDGLIYSGSINGLDCQIAYTFGDSGLYMCMYNIIEEHTNSNLYFSDYSKLLALLKEKYGAPFNESTDWSNSHYKEKPEYWGTALSLGHVSRQAVFNTTDSTSVLLKLHGDNFKIGFVLSYANMPLLKHARSKTSEQMKRDEL